ncbi:hypothetical protein MAH1_13350 [Sessilibacter sp. MAH1]
MTDNNLPKMSPETESDNPQAHIKALTVIRVLGWANTLAFIILLITAKGSAQWHSLATNITGIICIAGTAFLYGFSAKFFNNTEKTELISYFKPYRLGTMILIFGALYVLGIRYLGG